MKPRSAGDKRHDGFSLVELMITLVIELCIIGAAVTVYLKARTGTRDARTTLGRLQENARHAMGLVEADVRMANFWGLHNQPDSHRDQRSFRHFPSTAARTG